MGTVSEAVLELDSCSLQLHGRRKVSDEGKNVVYGHREEHCVHFQVKCILIP